MKFLTLALFWLYALVFVVSGLGGVGGAHEEMPMLFGLHLDQVAPNEAPSLMSQYRFLRAAEAGCGISWLLFRKEIWSDKKHNAFFLLVTLLLPASRTVSLVIDGLPHVPFIGLMAIEYGLFALFFLHAKRTVWSKEADTKADATATADAPISKEETIKALKAKGID